MSNLDRAARKMVDPSLRTTFRQQEPTVQEPMETSEASFSFENGGLLSILKYRTIPASELVSQFLEHLQLQAKPR